MIILKEKNINRIFLLAFIFLYFITVVKDEFCLVKRENDAE